MRILVTGSDGFIGSHVARGLAVAGHSVTRLVFARTPAADELRVDLTLPAALSQLPVDIDVVVHAAGAVDAHASFARMFAANVTTTQNLLAWASRRVRHFIHFSSVAVYSPLVLGEDRKESTPRLGLRLGLPYMRTKALAERAVEQSGVPYTLVRPPVVLGKGDTVLSQGLRDALCHDGVPLVPGAHLEHRVSVALVEGLAEVVRLCIARGPLGGPLHAVDASLTVAELAGHYARALRRPLHTVPMSWSAAMQSRNEAGIAWLVASTRFGQHYRAERLLTELGYRANFSLESAIEGGLSSLQGRSDRLF